MCSQHALTAETWDDMERLMYAEEPRNFRMEGETRAALEWDFPPAAEVVRILRDDPATRILPGRQPERPAAAFSVLETTNGWSDLSTPKEAAFADTFRGAPLERAVRMPFAVAHFNLERFFAPGQFLEGFDTAVMSRWKSALLDAGFVFDRCLPYIFISGARDVGTFHHDVSNVVAWQVEGTKRFCGYANPRSMHPLAERRKHNSAVALPGRIAEADLLVYTMRPGDVLFNQLLTPHWVQNTDDSLAFSINIGHKGLQRESSDRGLCLNEAEHVAYKLMGEMTNLAMPGFWS